MRRFDIVALKGAEAHMPYAIILQEDGLFSLDTIIVAPLRTRGSLKGIPELNPVAKLNHTDYLIQIERLAAVHKSRLGDCIGSGAEHEYQIGRALDRLLFAV